MDLTHSRQLLNCKLQTRINEAKCKALIDDKLLSSLFSQDIQKMHYETVHKKLELAYASKKLSAAHHQFLCRALDQYSDAIKSNKSLLQTVNSELNRLTDKEKDLLELREETILGMKEAMEIEIDSILDNESLPQLESDLVLPTPPNDPPSRKKALTFTNVLIKTIDEAESEKEERMKQNSNVNQQDDENEYYQDETENEVDLTDLI